jgi:Fic family protein
LDIRKLFTSNSDFLYSHENLKVVNALSRAMSRSDYRKQDAGIVDIDNDFVHFFPETNELENRLNGFFAKYQSQLSIQDIAVAHCEFILIHPFSDGNGRTARFIADINLASIGFEPFLNKVIERKSYYFSVREYLKYGNIKPIVNFMSEFVNE